MEVSISARHLLQRLGSCVFPHIGPNHKPSNPVSSGGRSARLMHILSYNAVFHLFGFMAAYYALGLFGLRIEIAENKTWNWQALVTVIILLPGTIAVTTSLSPMTTELPIQHEARKWDTFYLCLVSKGTNRETVLRSLSLMRHLQQDDRIHLVLLTEEGRDFTASQLGCDVVFVPHDYEPPLALYKARSLEYFRKFKHLRGNDWVLHLDEETLVDDHCLGACIDFIERTSWEWGQGIITYNTVNYWTHPILTFAEVLRFRDDLGRFQFQHGRVHKTIWGCHGSFLLSSGRVENAVSWDTTCLAEDFWFANKAWQLGYGGGFVPSIAREQSDWTLMDFLNQRRRWFCGMFEVGFFGQLMSLTWLLSTLELPLSLLSCTGIFCVPYWVSIWMRVYFSATSFTVLFALVVQDLDADVPISRMGLHLLFTPVLSLATQCLQTTAVIYSIVSPPKGFHVVAKK